MAAFLYSIDAFARGYRIFALVSWRALAKVISLFGDEKP
jgi:hypothetical protein